MKRNPKPNLGLVKSSQAKKTISKQSKSSSKSESVSKYFLKNEDDNTPTKKTEASTSTSPSVTYLKEIQCITTNDENDFKTPKPVKKLASIFTKAANSRTAQTKRSCTRKPRTSSRSNDKLKLQKTEVNEEHLQVALALSLSDQQKNVFDEDPSTVYPCTQQIRENAKRTLEQYGFKRNKSKENLNIATFDVNKRKKKSRYAHITPVLFLRSQEDREEIINKKVAAILNNPLIECVQSCCKGPSTLHSTDLQKYQASKNIFNKNNLSLPELNSIKFYLENLKISPSEFKCGDLLKKWEEIPGRELSPVRKENCIKNSDNKKIDNTRLNVKTKKHRSISPDLFDSDDELSSHSPSLCNNSNYLNKNNLEQEQQFSFSSPSNKSSLEHEQPLNQFSQNNSSPSNESNYLNKSTLEHEQSLDQFSKINSSPSNESNYLNKSTREHEQSLNHFSKIISSPNTKNNYLNSSSLEHEQSKINSSPSNKSSDSLGSKKSLQSGDNESKSNSDQSDLELIETGNGICHFESFCEDMKTNLSQKIHVKNGDADYESESDVIDLSQDDEEIFSLKTSEENIKLVNDSSNSSNHVEIMEINGDMNKSLAIKDDFIDLSQDSSNSNLSSQPSDSNHNERMQLSNDVSKLCLELDNTILELSDKSINLEESPTQKDSTQTIDFNKLDKINNFKKHDSMSSIDSSASQDSIYISDEELNYSSVYCTPVKPKLRSKFEVSDDELSNFDANEAENLTTAECVNSSDDLVNWVCETSKFSITNSPEKINGNIVTYQEEIINMEFDSSELNISKTNLPEKYHEIENEEHEISFLNISSTNSPQKNTPIRNEEINRINSKIKHPRVIELSKLNSPFCQKSASKLFGDSLGNLLEQTDIINLLEYQSPNKCNENTQNTPEKQNQTVDANVTPNGELIVKTKDVTPMPNYDTMDSPEIINELSKYGLKKLKRQRGVHLLKYLYDSTHPVLEQHQITEDDGDKRVVKRRRKLIADDDSAQPQNPFQLKIIGDAVNLSEPIEDMIFERKQSKRVISCRLPLHIAWHNLLSSNVELQENILLYEPLQVEVLYSMLKEQGYNYHIQDLITFLDKKCITIRINQGQGSRIRKKSSKIL